MKRWRDKTGVLFFSYKNSSLRWHQIHVSIVTYTCESYIVTYTCESYIVTYTCESYIVIYIHM